MDRQRPLSRAYRSFCPAQDEGGVIVHKGSGAAVHSSKHQANGEASVAVGDADAVIAVASEELTEPAGASRGRGEAPGFEGEKDRSSCFSRFLASASSVTRVAERKSARPRRRKRNHFVGN